MTFRYATDAGGHMVEAGNAPDAQALETGQGVYLEIAPGLRPEIVQRALVDALDAYRVRTQRGGPTARDRHKFTENLGA